MLQQFNATSEEIVYLLSNDRLRSDEQTQLEYMKGQDKTQANLEQREITINELNNRLAQAALRECSSTKISCGALGLTRVPQNIIALLQEHQATLESIDLSDNNLSTLDFSQFHFRNLKSLDLSSNRLSEDDISKIRDLLPSVNIISLGQKGISIEAMTSSRQSAYVPHMGGRRSNEGINEEKHIPQSTVDNKTKNNGPGGSGPCSVQ